MHTLSKNQQQIMGVIDGFMENVESVNLFIGPPKKFFGLSQTLLTFMATFKNEKSQFKQLVYMVDTKTQAHDAYTSFCQIIDKMGHKYFIMNDGNEGQYRIQFSSEGLIYRFIHKDSNLFRGMKDNNVLFMFNLGLFDDLFLTSYKNNLKSIFIVRGDLMSDHTWREAQTKNAESYFCVIKL